MIFNSSRVRLRQETEKFAKSIPAGAMVLDAGAGDAPYKHFLGHARYESADFEKVDKEYAQSTYVCDLKSIPVENGRYDFVLFNQVMEHLPDPRLVLAELLRVMRPGGRLMYSAPLFYEQHEEPYDFYRYTSHGVRHLFEEAGFAIERLDWLEGYYSTVAYQMHKMAEHLPLRPSSIAPWGLGFLLWPVMVAMKVGAVAACLFFHGLEIMKKYTGGGHPKNYVAIVAKPAT
jgi:SAM-dependent methyltransferase